MMHVIHFADLEDMVPELILEEKIRLTKIKSIEGQTQQGVMIEVIGIHVRQIQDDRVFSWMYPIARYRTNRGEPLEESDETAMTEGWVKAEEIAKLIVNRLLDKDMYKVRPGIVDIGEASPLAGYWSLLDDVEEDQTEEE